MEMNVVFKALRLKVLFSIVFACPLFIYGMGEGHGSSFTEADIAAILAMPGAGNSSGASAALEQTGDEASSGMVAGALAAAVPADFDWLFTDPGYLAALAAAAPDEEGALFEVGAESPRHGSIHSAARESDEEQYDEESEFDVSAEAAADGSDQPSDLEGNFKCGSCEKSFETERGLTVHIRRMHKEIVKKFHVCDHPGCGISFDRIAHFQRHRIIHTVEKPFKCTHEGCKRSFARSDDCVAHMRSHTGEKPFKCPYEGCDIGFCRKGDLNKHKRTHTGEKRFVCDQCSKKFTQSGNLTRHKTRFGH